VRALGLDAAGDLGWLGVVVDGGGFRGAALGTVEGLVQWAEPVGAIGIDIPIGHVPGGRREADVQARRFVGPRRSSVFASPPAEAVSAASYQEANARLAAAGMPRMSRQAWNLVPRMREAAAVADVDPRVHEVHPEVSFCELAAGHLPWSKTSWNGLLLRRRLLAQAGILLPDHIAEVAGAVADDVVDAAVVAWSAQRIAEGTAEPLPRPPEPGDGRPVAIWR
jgi:predicted RNase H-like nuclease